MSHATRQTDVREASGRGRGGGADPDDGTAYTAGEVTHVELELTKATAQVTEVRDVIPENWSVVAGDHESVETADGAKYVTFAADYDGGAQSFEYVVETPAESGTYVLGPAEARAEGGDELVPVEGTQSDEVVVGADSP